MTRATKTILLSVLALSTLPLSGCNRRGEFSPVDMWNRSRVKPLEQSEFFENTNSSRPIPPGTVYRGQTERDKLYPPAENGMSARRMEETGRIRNSADAVNTVGVTPRGVNSGGMSPGTGGSSSTRGGTAGNPGGAGNDAATMGPTGDYRVRGGGATMTRFPFPITKKVLLRGKERYEIYCTPCHGRTGEGDGMIVRRGFSQPPTYHSDRLRKAPVGHFFDVITNGYGAMYPYADKVEPEDRWAITAYIRALQLARNAKLSDVPANERANIGKPKPKASAPAHGGGH